MSTSCSVDCATWVRECNRVYVYLFLSLPVCARVIHHVHCRNFLITGLGLPAEQERNLRQALLVESDSRSIDANSAIDDLPATQKSSTEAPRPVHDEL